MRFEGRSAFPRRHDAQGERVGGRERGRERERERPSTSEQCYVSGTIAIRVNKLWSVCHIHEAARVHQPRSTLLSVSSPLGEQRGCVRFLVSKTLTLYYRETGCAPSNRTEPNRSTPRSILLLHLLLLCNTRSVVPRRMPFLAPDLEIRGAGIATR